MNYYEQKLKEKKEYLHKKPEQKKKDKKKAHIYAMKHTKKNAQFGMFPGA